MISVLRKIKFKTKRKGSTTIEVALIFPMIMLVLFGIIYLTIVHYQNNVMIAESVRAMNRAGAYWQYIDMDKIGNNIKYDENNIPAPFDSSLPSSGIINVEMVRNRNPYRTIIDIFSEGISRAFHISLGNKKYNAKEYVKARMAGVKFKQYTDDSKNEIGDVIGAGFMFFGDDLKVDISKSYINPLLNLSKALFGNNSIMEDIMNKKIKVSSVISNQSEFIRNIDTIYDLGTNIYEFVVPKKEDSVNTSGD